MNKTLAAILTLLCLTLAAQAQELVWDVDFNTVFNNREGGDDMRPDQTFLFTRLKPEVGLQIGKDSVGGIHLLKGGVSWYQPINDTGKGYAVDPILYYRFNNSHWSVAVGAMPRTITHREPLYMLSDSMNYVSQRLRGVWTQYRHDDGSYFDAYLDWRQMQSKTRREAFMVYGGGRWYAAGTDDNGFWLGGHLRYNHLAKQKEAPEGQGVNDDFTFSPLVGYSHRGTRSLLDAEAGAVLNLERARVDHKTHSPAGFVARVNWQYRWLEAEENLFAGKDLFPLYERFGSELNMGDTYYRSKFYSRTDLKAHIVRTAFVDLNVGLTFHATDKITGFWQQVACRFYFDRQMAHKRFPKQKLTSTY